MTHEDGNDGSKESRLIYPRARLFELSLWFEQRETRLVP